MEILFVTSEITPYSRRSTLGDVCAALPKALRGIGHKVTVISPLWQGVEASAHGFARRLSGAEVVLGGTRHTCTLHDGRTTGGVDLIFVGSAHEGLFAAPGDAKSQHDASLALSQVAMQVAAQRDTAPEVIHAHGAFAAPVLALAAEALPAAARVLSLPDPRDNQALRTSVAAAQRVIVGSQGEIAALESLVGAAGKAVAIPNGLDAARWNPLTDPRLPARFDPAEQTGKARCKDALQFDLGLPVRPDVPILCLAGDPTPLLPMLESLLRNDVQLVVLGHAAQELSALQKVAELFADRLRLVEQADEPALHRSVAAADFMLLPALDARFGDLHLAAQRYGALPIANRVGALADAVIDTEASLMTGTGFVFEGAQEMLGTCQRALAAFAKREAFAALRKRVMMLDLSWDKSARRYEHLYRSLKTAQSL